MKVSGKLLFNEQNIDWDYISRFIEIYKCSNLFNSFKTVNTETEGEKGIFLPFYISNDNKDVIFTASAFNSTIPEPITFTESGNFFLSKVNIIKIFGPCTLIIDSTPPANEIKAILFLKENNMKIFYNDTKDFSMDFLSYIHSNLVYSNIPMEDITEQMILDTYKIYEELMC